MGSCSIRPSRETRRASVAQSTQVLSAVVPITGCGTRHLEDAPVATRLKQPAAHAPQPKQSARDKRRQPDSSARRFHAQEADGSQASAQAAVPASTPATPDTRAPRQHQGAREESTRETTPPPYTAAPFPGASVSSVPSTPSVGSNLSVPSKSTGQVASPGTATRFTAGCLVQVVDMLRRLDERAKTEAQTPASVASPETRENHGAGRAGSPADPGPLGTPTSTGGAPGDQDEEQIEPSL